MKKEWKLLVLMGLAAIMFTNGLRGEERDRNGSINGLFIRLTEQRIGDEGYMGIVVKPFDRDDHITVFVPRNRDRLAQTARKFEEGTRLDITFVNEDGHKFIRSIKAKLRRETREEGYEGEKQVIVRREIRHDSSERDERPESRRSRDTRRDFEPERSRRREERQDRGPAAQLDQLQRQLREVVSGHLDRMSRSVREVMADHLWRMDAEFRELRKRVDRIERELDQLREENERLRRELRERTRPRREREEQTWERRENRKREEHRESRNNTR